MKERIAAFESAQRAASYLGSASAIAVAPSAPIWLSHRFKLFSGVLTKPSRNAQSKERQRFDQQTPEASQKREKAEASQ